MTKFLKSSPRCSLSGVQRLAVPTLALALVLLAGLGVLAQTQKATAVTRLEKLPIPGQAEWDLAPLRKYFAILETRYDAENKRVVWLAEARRGFDNVGAVFDPSVRFYDAADARVHDTTLGFDPNDHVLRGERIRISLSLPDEATLARTKRVLMLTREQEFPPRPTATVEQDGLRGLPGQANWDLAPLRKYFAILETRYDAENNRVVWLAEARRGFDNVGAVFDPSVRFYDAADARVHDTTLGFDPNDHVLRGERIRISLSLPDEATLARTKRVLFFGWIGSRVIGVKREKWFREFVGRKSRWGMRFGSRTA